MTLKLYVNYNTQWGEEIFVSGSSAELGNNDIYSALKLEYTEDGMWSCEVTCNPAEKDRIISYKYFIKHKKEDGTESIFFENGPKRKLALYSDAVMVTCYDQWQGNNDMSPFLSAPFSEVFYAAKSNPYTQTHQFNQELILKATIPNVPQDCTIQICGNINELGNWNIKKAPSMSREVGCKWTLVIPADNLPEVLEYKFVFNNQEWEENSNRSFKCPQMPRHSSVIKENSDVVFPDIFSLHYMKNPRFAGCSIPVFSLRTKESHGIGDFSDIKALIDFMAKSGMKIMQLLPINDTSINMNWRDSYPYNCVSSFALHPIYINLFQVLANSQGHDHLHSILNKKDNSVPNKNSDSGIFGGLLSGKKKKAKTAEEDNPADKISALVKAIKHEGKLLNIKTSLDYDDVLESKMRLLRTIFEIEKENTFAQPGFYTFVKANKYWLTPYTKFCVLRDKNKTADFNRWTEKSATKAETDFYLFIQYHLYLQMSAVTKYAHEKGIVLKGDIPIGVAPHSVEVWDNPGLFHTDESAGAPPDNFSKDGQNWGFPTYNWEEMEKDHYSWWRNRFIQMSKYFDAYRLDHILGFFRIWEIPTIYKSSLMGHFSPAIKYTREEIARKMGITEAECRDDWFIDNCTDGALAGTFGAASDSVLIKSVNKNSTEYETLFIEDPYVHRLYHPMIGAHDSYAYFSLTPKLRSAYDALYNDFFYSRNNKLWYHNAVSKLQQLVATSNMLACGEDLGMRNPAVDECMKTLRILQLELMTMPKEAGFKLGNPQTYPYLSVCTTSTHDCETLRMWLGKMLHGENSDATPQECENMINENLAAKSMFAILPLQDWMSLSVSYRTGSPQSERINNPSDPNHYWRYRMPVFVEDLTKDTDFCNKIRCIIEKNGR